jgi:hypothetical protein
MCLNRGIAWVQSRSVRTVECEASSKRAEKTLTFAGIPQTSPLLTRFPQIMGPPGWLSEEDEEHIDDLRRRFAKVSRMCRLQLF